MIFLYKMSELSGEGKPPCAFRTYIVHITIRDWLLGNER